MVTFKEPPVLNKGEVEIFTSWGLCPPPLLQCKQPNYCRGDICHFGL